MISGTMLTVSKNVDTPSRSVEAARRRGLTAPKSASRKTGPPDSVTRYGAANSSMEKRALTGKSSQFQAKG